MAVTDEDSQNLPVALHILFAAKLQEFREKTARREARYGGGIFRGALELYIEFEEQGLNMTFKEWLTAAIQIGERRAKNDR